MSIRRPEQTIQRAVFEHLAVRRAAGTFAFHVPNGSSRAEAAKRAQGGGQAVEAHAGDAAIVASIELQHSVLPDTIRHALTRNGKGTASRPLGTLLDLLAKVAL